MTLATAPVGPTNPLPPLRGAGELHRDVEAVGVDDELRAGLAYGRADTVLPYLMQDGYDRVLSPTSHPVAVLENPALRAEFLPGLGGRLRSLVDLRSGRELLHPVDVVQPANLALRNAWVAGGVEWNLGTTGHWPLTCSPLHTVRVRRADGSEALRMYEYERMRGTVVRIDASLAAEGALVVTVTVRNPRDTEVPVYWWSNIAVPERDDVRVVVPAGSAYRFGYEGVLTTVPFPHAAEDGVDRSYSTRSRDAADYFFELGSSAMPWIAALDGEGRGLVHASSARLRGRKLFVWGTGRGGGQWQRWLGDGERRYLEIQAGLARTQLEHLRMPAGATWRWTEVYAAVDADASAVHGEWGGAVDEVAGALDRSRLPAVLAREAGRDESGDVIVEVLHEGSGWGALEDRRRRADGESPIDAPETPFPASQLGPEQAWWTDSSAPDPRVDEAPLSYQSDSAWATRVAERDGWLARLHEGVLAVADGRWGDAAAAWRESIAIRDNGWAWRNLAVAADRDGDAEGATDAYARARLHLPELLPLAVEAVDQLISRERHAEALRLVESLDDRLRRDGRIRFAEARAALGAGDLERCAGLIDEGIEIADLREGETSLDGLWTDYRAAMIAREEGVGVTPELLARVRRELPPPERYDFRMRDDAGL